MTAAMWRWLAIGAGVVLLGLFPLGSSARTTAKLTWSGDWSSTWGPMRLEQTGSSVKGTYTHDNGQITGTISGNKLSGKWTEAPSRAGHDAGSAELTMAPNGKSFTGRFNYEDSTVVWRTDWYGSCSAGPCLSNGDNPGRATYLFAARQTFNRGGDVAIAASAKLATPKRCTEPGCVLKLTPTGTYYGLWTQEDGDVRIRFRISGVNAVRDDKHLRVTALGTVTGREGTGMPQCAVGSATKIYGAVTRSGQFAGVAASIRCAGEYVYIRKFTLRLVGNALTG